jgi:hypothetical protein
VTALQCANSLDSGKPLAVRRERRKPHLRRRGGRDTAVIRRAALACPETSLNRQRLRQKCHRKPAAARDRHLTAGIMAGFGDNRFNGIVAFVAHCLPPQNAGFDLELVSIGIK